MDQATKERVVGAVVIVGLAVLLIPFVLDGPGPTPAPRAAAPDVPAVEEAADGSRTYRYDLETPPAATTAAADEPAAPATAPADTAPQPTAEPPAPTQAAPRSAPAPVRESAPVATAKPSAPAEVLAREPAAPKGDTAWAAQAGTFSKAASARDLAGRLQRLGFKAFVMDMRDGSRTLYRVRVGPVGSRAEAVALAERINREGGLKGDPARPVTHP